MWTPKHYQVMFPFGVLGGKEGAKAGSALDSEMYGTHREVAWLKEEGDYATQQINRSAR